MVATFFLITAGCLNVAKEAQVELLSNVLVRGIFRLTSGFFFVCVLHHLLFHLELLKLFLVLQDLFLLDFELFLDLVLESHQAKAVLVDLLTLLRTIGLVILFGSGRGTNLLGNLALVVVVVLNDGSQLVSKNHDLVLHLLSLHVRQILNDSNDLDSLLINLLGLLRAQDIA